MECCPSPQTEESPLRQATVAIAILCAEEEREGGGRGKEGRTSAASLHVLRVNPYVDDAKQ